MRLYYFLGFSAFFSLGYVYDRKSQYIQSSSIRSCTIELPVLFSKEVSLQLSKNSLERESTINRNRLDK